MKNKFIVIEWVDGSGKATQTKLLVENLKKDWFSADSISFPAYWEWSCRFVENFLNWVYGHPSEINWYLWSSFYVLDRFEQSPKIKQKIKDNDFLISDRYSTANFVHRWTQFLEKWDIKWLNDFFDWVYDFEFDKAGLPQPDLIIFLSLSMDNIRKLINKKIQDNRKYVTVDGGLDLAEQDIKHQESSLKIWKEYLPKYFKNYTVLECENEAWEILTIEEINKKLITLIKNFIK